MFSTHSKEYQTLLYSTKILRGVVEILRGGYEAEFPKDCTNVGVGISNDVRTKVYSGADDVHILIDDIIECNYILSTTKINPSHALFYPRIPSTLLKRY